MVGTPKASSLAAPLFWSFAPVIALTVAARYLLLPGIDASFVASMERSGPVPSLSGTLGVFALGVTPFISATIFVELVSLAVPRLSRLRHGNPDGRRKLERAARLLAIVLAAVQALMIAWQLDALTAGTDLFMGGGPLISVPVVAASLVGGFCITLVIAELVSRQGIVNGYFTVIAVGAVPGAVADLRAGLARGMLVGALQPRHALVVLGAIAVVVVATWLALRGSSTGSGAAPSGAKALDAGSPSPSPYREARAMAVHPWVPIPSSSFAAYTITTALFSLPAALVPLAPAFRDITERLSGLSATAFLGGFGLLLMTTTVVLTRILHRPSELADLASSTGVANAGGSELAKGATAARNAALAPTLLFFAAYLLAAQAAGAVPHLGVSLLLVPMIVALLMDFREALRIASDRGHYVSVWQERRASAAPVLLAALATKGIEAKTRGMHLLSLFQTFAPYAPADIVVHESDAARASATLRHLLLGGPQPLPEGEGAIGAGARAAPATPTQTGEVAAVRRPARRSYGLAAAAAAGLAVLVLAKLPIGEPTAGPSRRAKLAVVRVDDSIDPFSTIDASDVPPDVELRFENAPTGIGNGTRGHATETITYARVVMAPGESLERAIGRVDPWVQRVQLPAGKRFAWQADDAYDEQTGTSQVVGARTFVLTGEPIITNVDIIDAAPSVTQQSAIPEIYVAVTMTPEAGERFGDATREWTNRRLAIMLDGRITSAPIVKTEIRGGRMSITMGAGDPERQLAQAKELAAGLSLSK